VKKQSLVSLVLMLTLFATLRGQQQESPAAARQQGDDEVVRITTNLVQVDAVVTDDKGRPVTDLRPEDFEILEDGHPQVITNFSYISSASASAAEPAAATPAPAKNAPPVRPARLRQTDAHRTIVLVVDDLGMSFESINFTRQALKKFLEEQLRPDDVAAVVRTRGGVDALQQLTSDKKQLTAAIERVRWNSFGRTGLSAVQTLSGQGVGPGSPVVDTLKFRNFRDGQQVFAGGPKALDADGQSAFGPVQAGGRLTLGTEMTPGEYILQVVVTDLLARGEQRTATQWIDFEVVK
jgi:hypothetical protein